MTNPTTPPGFSDPFAVALVIHPNAEPGARALADDLYHWLTDTSATDLLASGSGLPVTVFAIDRPEPARLGVGADRRAIVLILDDAMVGDRQWRKWFGSRPADARTTWILCAVTKNFASFGTLPQVARVYNYPAERRLDEARVLIGAALLHALAVQAGPLFISHCKRDDGLGIARVIRDAIDQRPVGERFFDAVDILLGEDLQTKLAERLRRATVIVVDSDQFSTRYWCQWEVLVSKQQQRPLVVVDALRHGVRRRFPYTANTPTLRWEPDRVDDPAMPVKVLAEALREALLDEHTKLLFTAIKHAGFAAHSHAFARVPEAASLRQLARELRGTGAVSPAVVLYPDPPLARPEQELLSDLADAEMVSCTQALAGHATPGRPLAGLRIAISISNSPDEALADRGLKQDHIKRVAVAVARHMLAAGATLAYGGDLRVDGFTELLFNLARAYADTETTLPPDTIRSYLPWPESLKADTAFYASLPNEIEPLLIEPPPDVPDTVDRTKRVEADTPEHRYAWTRTLTRMRQRMAQETDARIVIGGQLQSAGGWPGLAEEAREHLRVDKPVYLLGAYGGMALAMIDAIRGGHPDILTAEQQLKPKAGEAPDLRARSYEHFNERASEFVDVEAIDFTALVDDFVARGVAGLRNGLSDDENHRLFESTSLTEQIALLLRGLRLMRAARIP